MLIKVVESDSLPLCVVLGKYAYSKFRHKIELHSAELNAWEAIAFTDFENVEAAH